MTAIFRLGIRICSLLLAMSLSFSVQAQGANGLTDRGSGVFSVDSNDWPGLVIVSSRAANGQPNTCSGTLIGPRVALTARHCVGIDGTIKIDGLVSIECSILPGPPPGACPGHLDLAICRFKDNIAGIARFENPTVGSGLTQNNNPVTLSGFGQPRPGTLRLGKATVSGAVSQTSGCFLVRGAAGCPGDSGGAVFAKKGRRDVLVGVISTGGVTPLSGTGQECGSQTKTVTSKPKTGAAKAGASKIQAGTAKPKAGASIIQTGTSERKTGIVDLSSKAAQDFIGNFIKSHPGEEICGSPSKLPPPGTCFN